MTVSKEAVYAVLAIVAFLCLLKSLNKRSRGRGPDDIKRLAAGTKEMLPSVFFRMRKSGARDFAGVYILYNRSRKKYYVGQAKRICKRVNDHFTGHGNGDVYADYRRGDRFGIWLLKLKGSGFRTLNGMERNAIEAYHAYDNGYNKTRGNKG